MFSPLATRWLFGIRDRWWHGGCSHDRGTSTSMKRRVGKPLDRFARLFGGCIVELLIGFRLEEVIASYAHDERHGRNAHIGYLCRPSRSCIVQPPEDETCGGPVENGTQRSRIARPPTTPVPVNIGCGYLPLHPEPMDEAPDAASEEHRQPLTHLRRLDHPLGTTRTALALARLHAIKILLQPDACHQVRRIRPHRL